MTDKFRRRECFLQTASRTTHPEMNFIMKFVFFVVNYYNISSFEGIT